MPIAIPKRFNIAHQIYFQYPEIVEFVVERKTSVIKHFLHKMNESMRYGYQVKHQALATTLGIKKNTNFDFRRINSHNDYYANKFNIRHFLHHQQPTFIFHTYFFNTNHFKTNYYTALAVYLMRTSQTLYNIQTLALLQEKRISKIENLPTFSLKKLDYTLFKNVLFFPMPAEEQNFHIKRAKENLSLMAKEYKKSEEDMLKFLKYNLQPPYICQYFYTSRKSLRPYRYISPFLNQNYKKIKFDEYTTQSINILTQHRSPLRHFRGTIKVLGYENAIQQEIRINEKAIFSGTKIKIKINNELDYSADIPMILPRTKTIYKTETDVNLSLNYHLHMIMHSIPQHHPNNIRFRDTFMAPPAIAADYAINPEPSFKAENMRQNPWNNIRYTARLLSLEKPVIQIPNDVAQNFDDKFNINTTNQENFVPQTDGTEEGKNKKQTNVPESSIRDLYILIPDEPEVSVPTESVPTQSVPAPNAPEVSVPTKTVPTQSVPTESMPTVPTPDAPNASVPPDQPNDSGPETSVPEPSVPPNQPDASVQQKERKKKKRKKKRKKKQNNVPETLVPETYVLTETVPTQTMPTPHEPNASVPNKSKTVPDTSVPTKSKTMPDASTSTFVPIKTVPETSVPTKSKTVPTPDASNASVPTQSVPTKTIRSPEDLKDNYTTNYTETHSEGSDWNSYLNKDSIHPIRAVAFRITQNETNKEYFEKPTTFLSIIENRINPIMYAFQIERGEKQGLKHYQGFFKLKDKIRTRSLQKLICQTTNTPQELCWVRPAFDITASIQYATKKESRIDGPWTRPSDL